MAAHVAAAGTHVAPQLLSNFKVSHLQVHYLIIKCNRAVMSNFLVLSIDSSILLFAWSYLENEVQFVAFDSLSVFQLSSSFFALYKLSWLRKYRGTFFKPKYLWIWDSGIHREKNNPFHYFFFRFFYSIGIDNFKSRILYDTTAEMYVCSTITTSVTGNSREAAATYVSRQLWSNVSKY